MGKTLTIRNIPEKVYDRFANLARRSHRNAEAHVRFLIEKETEQMPLETCGELLAAYAEVTPAVAVAEIEALQSSRGKRSQRP